MDAAILQQLWDIHDRRKAAADARAAEWVNNPPLDGDGKPMAIGLPLVAVPLVAQRSLAAAAKPGPDDGPDAERTLRDLLLGARRAEGPEVAIYLHHLRFLLDRVPAPDAIRRPE
jgi:hypothetical protein